MAVQAQSISKSGPISHADLQKTLSAGLSGKFSGQKVLVLVPDRTRSLPLPILFRLVVEILRDTARLDFMVALGTHAPLS